MTDGRHTRTGKRNQHTTRNANKADGNMGNIACLGSNIYTYRVHKQGDMYTRTTEAIADYVERKYFKEIRILVKHQKDADLKEPVQPSKEEAKSQFVINKYKTKLKLYYSQKEKYEEHKVKTFVIIKGQCTLTMKNKIESLKGYSNMETTDDVIGLLKALKELAYATHKMQYGYWTILQSVNRVLRLRQGKDESLVLYYKRFNTGT